MTNLMVARRDGTLLNKETGERYRLVRGKTLADAHHPAVVANPDAFMPMTVDLRAGSQPHDPERVPSVDLDAALAERDGYREQLAAIATGMHERGLIGPDVDIRAEGWLAAAVFAAIDGSAAALPSDGTGVEAPKRTSRGRKPQA